ncbi:PIR protein [Plasmodium yoelii]|uniref:PIR protein n=3 Tax=Plasmodium yoelii TaxID=5861 RepID=A0AAE9WKH6_PLAYO|nr:PIR protein [Plasmodium yoelii]XP_034493339.1 PIR protein [Plasmodium yoelii]WBY54621.1 PIR protein [Plasmodium yoelii yoelii]WBY57713.1 PIR protein [Plasmodium yoelii yoelii]VTZ71615.1 PIR protein [Plasmodium yoelii]VTZ78730.1 PIR protein [Plasmodium yoelii]|eukprot:XP_022811307.1 PIR protein [Plasmodium yoelii]
MDNRLCGPFNVLRNYLPDELDNSAKYEFDKNEYLKKYCPNGDSDKKCETDLDKIKAGFLCLFEQIIVNNIDNLSKEEVKVFIIYIMIWLNYMLNLKKVNDTNNLNEFYIKYTEKNTDYEYCKTDGIDCDSALKNQLGYDNFTEIINERKDLLNIKFKDPSKVYDLFKLLCNMYYDVNGGDSNPENQLKIANQFFEKYKELNGYSDITEDSPYYQVLSTLSNDYNNIINECSNCQSSNFPSFLTYSRRSVIKNTLISIAFIFASVSIFLGIAYKYSLFGFRKRFQKQQLREKLKNIKKRMNH